MTIWKFVSAALSAASLASSIPSLADTQDHMQELPKLVFARAIEDIKIKTSIAQHMFGIGDVSSRWDANLDTGTITFTGKQKTAVATVQIIGTYNKLDGTWLWGWGHPSVEPKLAQAATLAKEFGVRNSLSDYTTRKIKCSEADAWQFTAVASYLSGAQGAYRGPSGSTLVFMTFGTVTLSKSEQK